jgi:chromosome partitioning protein
MIIISFVNQKGGVGKTTTVFNLAKAVANKKKNVLLIDLDPQANLTISIGLSCSKVNNILDLLNKDKELKECIYSVGNLDIIPSSILLSTFDLQFSNYEQREFLLKKALKGIQEYKQYDYIFIDNSPALSLLTFNSLVYCKSVIIPMKLDVLSLHGLNQLLDTISLIRNKLNPDLKIRGVVGTFYDRTNCCKDCLKTLQDIFKDKVYKTYIRQNTNIKEAPGYKQDIFTYKNRCNGSIDYKKLANEFLSI